MADAKVLQNNFNKAELLEFAAQNNFELVTNGEPLNEENTNKELSEAIAALATPEQVTAAIEMKKARKSGEDPTPPVEVTEPAVPEEDQEPTQVQVDPAAAPSENEEEGLSQADIEVGDKVYYPHKESHGGWRRGRVQSIEGEIASVTYADGTSRSYALSILKKA